MSAISGSNSGADGDHGRLSRRALVALAETRRDPLSIAELDALDELRRSGHPLRARHKLEEALKVLSVAPQVDDIHRLLWIRCHKQLLDCLVELKQADEVGVVLDRFVKVVKSEPWKARGADIDEQYRRLITLDLNMGQLSEALDVYSACRTLRLDPATLCGLALAAAELKRADCGAVELYLSCLELREGPQEDGEKLIVAALRDAVRIDLEIPVRDKLKETLKAIRRAVDARQLFWAKVFEAVGLLRLGKKDLAAKAAAACTPLDEADAESLTLLGIVACFTEAWEQARDLFQRATRNVLPDARAGYYATLSAAHCALLHPEEFPDDAACRAAFAAHQEALASIPMEGPMALDGAWVRLHLAAARDEGGAAQAVPEPPEEPMPRFRQMAAWVQILWLRGDLAPLRAWAARRKPGDRQGMLLAAAGEGLWHLLEGDMEAARGPVQLAVQLAGDKRLAKADRDLAPGAFWLRRELGLLAGEEAPAEEGATEPAEGTPCVIAHRERLAAWQALESGQLAAALQRCAAPAHRAGPAWLVHRTKLVALALSGAREEAAALAESLRACGGDRSLHRLLVGAWNLMEKRFGAAAVDLAPLVATEPIRPEAAMIAGEAMLRGGRDEEAKALLAKAAASVEKQTSRPLLLRPWRLQVPPEEWGRGFGPLADQCHLATLLLEANLFEAAAPILERAEKQLEAAPQQARKWLGMLLEKAATAFLEAGDLARACEFRRRAEKYIGATTGFAEALARAVAEQRARQAGAPLDLSDEVVEQFTAYVASWRDEAATLGGTGPGAMLMLGLRIDDLEPVARGELARRRTWTEEVARRRADWAWPLANLARAEVRAQEPAKGLEWLGRIPPEALAGEDLWLKGRALILLERFGEAAEAFDGSERLGFRPHEARIRRGFCRLIDVWRNRPDEPIDAAAFLAEFDLPDAEAEVALEFRELAVVCRAAVLLVLGRCGEAEGLLAPFQPQTQPASVVAALRGLAAIRSGEAARADRLWGPLCDGLPANDDLQLLMLWLQVSRPGTAILPAIAGRLTTVQRGGRGNRLFHLAAAQFEFRCGRLEAARKCLDAADKAGSPWQHPVLALLNGQVQQEARLAQARRNLAEGAFRQAAEQLAAEPEPWLAGPRMRLDRGLALAHAGALGEARAALEPLAAEDCDAAAVLAQLACREGDRPSARRLAERTLQLEADHPLASLVLASVAEADGEADAAASRWQKVAGLGEHVPGRLRAAARLALGRRAEAAGDLAGAETQYTLALAADPTWGVASGRLARLVARGTEAGDEKAAEALQRVMGVPPAERDLGAWLAASLLAERLGRSADQAEALSALVAHPAYGALSAAQQSALAKWGITAQLRQERFTEASAAIKALLQGEDSPDLRDMLVNCRLLEAGTLLRSKDADAGTLDKVAAAADDVLTQKSDHPIALLLAATVRVLRGQVPSDEHAALVARFRDDAWASPDLRLLAEINRTFVGAAAADRIDSLLAEASAGDDERLYHRLLAANQCRDGGRLMGLSEQGLAGAAEQVPMAPVDLAMFAARTHLVADRLDEAEQTLRRLHDAGRGNEASRWLHALTLARTSLRLIEEQKFLAACDALKRGADILKQANPVEVH